jgi:hypothetical protein
MITQRKHHLGPDVSPQAIFWRPIRYFSNVVMDDEDELDSFKFISFAFDNHVFDLRVYLQHPNMTVTLYLPRNIVSDTSIQSKINAAFMVLDVPDHAIAWQRGDELRRKGNDRLTEREARLLVLKIAALSDGNRSSTRLIKKAVPEFFELSPLDLKISETRRNEKMWHQIVGNVKAHHSGPSSIFSKGWAEPTSDGIKVTQAGLNYLKSIGFSLDLR